MKKIISLLLIFVLMQSSVYAFNFPEPDWGALLKEKTDIVKTDRVSLFAQNKEAGAPYFGAKNEPKKGVYFGMVTEYSDILKEKPSAYLTYIDFDSEQTDIYYPANEIIKSSDCIVTIGWNVNNLDSVRSKEGYIRSTLNNLKSYNKPMIIRFANEMNVNSLGDEPSKYIDAFRFVANIVHEYDSFAVCWSPNDLGALDRPFSYYYPGDEYVDWVGVSCYMKKYFMGNPQTAEKDSIYFMTGDYAWATNAVVPIIKFMAENGINKPVMLSECGVSQSTFTGENISSWANARLKNLYWNLIMEYPQIKLINYFNVYRPNEKEYYNLTSGEAIGVVNEAFDSGAYIKGEKKAEFSFVPAQNAGTKSGKIALYASAYTKNFDNPTVKYFADGFEVFSSNSAPHVYALDPLAFENGVHPLKVCVYTDEGEKASKNYSFFVKDGNVTIREENADFSDLDVKTEKRIEISVNGKKIEFDVPPCVISDRTLVPIRKFVNAIGVSDENIKFSQEDSSVEILRDNQKIYLKINDVNAKVDGSITVLDVPATIIDGRTLVPLRFVSETFGYNVEYTDSAELLSINMVR